MSARSPLGRLLRPAPSRSGGGRAHTSRRRAHLAIALPAAALFALFFVLPLIAVAIDAFGQGAFTRVFATPGFARSLAGSALLTLVAATLSTALGVGVALHLSRLPLRTRTWLAFVIALPLTFSGLIVAYGFILAYGRAGFVTQILASFGLDAATIGGALFTPTGLAFASSYYLIPRVVIGMQPVLVNFDAAQFAAAESLGATPAQAFRHVLLPQVAAPIVASFCLIAAVVFGAYGTALALVGTKLPILPLHLYSLISESGSDFPAAAALALLITAACSSILAAGEWIGTRHERHL
jgi:putative spermidine/putrescine transport system permease protein